MKNRIAVFLFFDPDGEVDDYVLYFLNGLREVASRIIVVLNGHISKRGRKHLGEASDRVIVRENVGYDTSGYLVGVNCIGWENLKNYDEMIWTNSSIFGPIYPFSEAFEIMDGKDVDWWGMQRGFEDRSLKTLSGIPIQGGYRPEYVLSNFYVFRREIFLSYEFKNYWLNLKPPQSYLEACFANEIDFTITMENAGFCFDTYESDAMRGFVPSHTVNNAYYEVTVDRVPIVRRRVFTNPKVEYLNVSNGQDAYRLMEHIRDNTEYPVGLIYSHLLRTQNMFDLHERLQQTYVVPFNVRVEDEKSKSKVALIFYIYYPDLIEACAKYAANMPDNSDVFVYTVSEASKSLAEQSFEGITEGNLTVKMMPNRGRDVSALLVTGREVIVGGQYDYICFMHDKKVPQTAFRILGEQYFVRCLDSMLGSERQVENIIALFDKNPFIGMLAPSPPYFSGYLQVINGNWGGNFEKTIEMMDSLGIKVPIDKNKPPIAPYGTMFWFRAKAFGKIMEREWTYDDFPEEPIPAYDGTVLHVLERVYSLSVQAAGYYPAYAVNDTQAAVDITNKTYMLQVLTANLKMRSPKNLLCFSDYKHFSDSPLPPPPPLVTVEKSPAVEDPLQFVNEYLRHNAEEVLDDIRSWLLIKKLVRRITPKFLWNIFKKIKCSLILERSKK